MAGAWVFGHHRLARVPGSCMHHPEHHLPGKGHRIQPCHPWPLPGVGPARAGHAPSIACIARGRQKQGSALGHHRALLLCGALRDLLRVSGKQPHHPLRVLVPVARCGRHVAAQRLPGHVPRGVGVYLHVGGAICGHHPSRRAAAHDRAHVLPQHPPHRAQQAGSRADPGRVRAVPHADELEACEPAREQHGQPRGQPRPAQEPLEHDAVVDRAEPQDDDAEVALRLHLASREEHLRSPQVGALLGRHGASLPAAHPGGGQAACFAGRGVSDEIAGGRVQGHWSPRGH
mmetsp:Transcript_29284/g.72305  ORF Transcript_29284/g.72305 Transcript_29284/m.72305 type:complete len:288 (+) Transcript_29284:3423-4286(+)